MEGSELSCDGNPTDLAREIDALLHRAARSIGRDAVSEPNAPRWTVSSSTV